MLFSISFTISSLKVVKSFWRKNGISCFLIPFDFKSSNCFAKLLNCSSSLALTIPLKSFIAGLSLPLNAFLWIVHVCKKSPKSVLPNIWAGNKEFAFAISEL